MLLFHLPLLLLLGASLIEATGGKGGGGGGGGKGGGGKGGGGGGKGGGGGGKGGGGGGKKGLHGNWVRHGPALAGADYSSYYSELYQQPVSSPNLRPARYSQPPANRPVYVPSYPPVQYYPLDNNRLYEKPPIYGKDYGMEYGKGYGDDFVKSYYPITQGWYGSYDKGWQGTGGPTGYYKVPDYASDQDDKSALYIRKGLQDYQGAFRLKNDGGQRT